jgi:hypothetical protein
MCRALFIIILFAACHGDDSSPTAPPLNTAALTGKVTDKLTTVPLDRVQVTVTQSGQTIATLSASTGNYSFFTGLLPGTATITAKATGYATATGTTNLATGSNRYDIQLQPAP